ncbi:CoA binding domain-containing protein [Xylariaceae sp. FL0804]|nr:CoA binding domain-containing protein [Xylariaceae sp. FL0804]
MTTEATVKAFFSTPQFAVVGASSNPAKFGHTIFEWYLAHDLPVTPINATSDRIATSRHGARRYAAVRSPFDLPRPRDTALSVVTPPAATLAVLRAAATVGVPAVWLQPGSWDDRVLDFVGRSGRRRGRGQGQQHPVARSTTGITTDDDDDEDGHSHGKGGGGGEGRDDSSGGEEDGFAGLVVVGEGGGARGHGGWCVLVDGERGLRSAGKL